MGDHRLRACVRSVGPSGWVASAGSGRSGLAESYELVPTLRPHVRSNIWFARGLSTAPDTMNGGLRPHERFPKRGRDPLVHRWGVPDEFKLPSRSWPRCQVAGAARGGCGVSQWPLVSRVQPTGARRAASAPARRCASPTSRGPSGRNAPAASAPSRLRWLRIREWVDVQQVRLEAAKRELRPAAPSRPNREAGPVWPTCQIGSKCLPGPLVQPGSKVVERATGLVAVQGVG